MKTHLAVITSLFLACSINAQTKPNAAIERQLKSAGANATVHFDANSKVTTLKGVAENFSDTDMKRAGVRAMNFAVGALYAGDKIERSIDPLTFSFWVMSGGKPRFGEDHSFVAINGADRIDLGFARYVARRDGMEYLNFSLTREQISKVAAASVFMIGGKPFTPTSSQKQLLHTVLASTQVN